MWAREPWAGSEEAPTSTTRHDSQRHTGEPSHHDPGSRRDGWLRSQCGRPWDDVWSEICDGLSVRNATTAHVRDHADDFVVRNCTLIDGEVRDSRGAPLASRWGRRGRFYVDPRDNTLRE